jgi:hypothetical protein
LRPRLEDTIRRVEHEHRTDNATDDQADHEFPRPLLERSSGPSSVCQADRCRRASPGRRLEAFVTQCPRDKRPG